MTASSLGQITCLNLRPYQLEVGVGRTKATGETLGGTDADALCTKLTAIYARSSARPITGVDEVPKKRGEPIPGE